jgi:hypothetical protein
MARVLIARGHDATDVAIASTLGVAELKSFAATSVQTPHL